MSTFVEMAAFHLQYGAVANGEIPVKKYLSKETGVSVYIVETDGVAMIPPLVNGCICLATEALDDDGLPHALQHLVFKGGSEDYPYKPQGILQKFASRGTYAWTDTSNTCYAMKNAASEEFLQNLPRYMDNILYPTITESGYITEVHNIDGSGEDGGIVYCEMQARENNCESRTYLALLRAMYPGQCGYNSETGGMLKNLRESTSYDKVKRYHEEFYRPENVCLIIAGSVKPDDVFAALESVEKKIIAKGSRSEFCRPWQNPVPALTASVKETINYPSDEKSGRLIIGFRGPKSQSLYEHLCLSILTEYLEAKATSRYAGSAYFDIIENSVLTVYISFKNADVEKLKDIEEAFMDVLSKIIKEETIDMNKMASIIHKKKQDTLSNLKEFYCITEMIIGHFLYGGDHEEDLYGRLNQAEMCDKIYKSEPVQYWLNLIKKYFIDTPRVVIIGLPSRALQEEMRKEEEERLEKQKEELGVEGLKECKLRLERAEEENARPAPNSENIPIIPGIDCLTPNHFRLTEDRRRRPYCALM